MNEYILAIETSCDDTSIAIIEGFEVIALKTFSQINEHKKHGGVIPEIASRLHSKYIFELIEETINDSGIKMEKIDHIAVTGGPGLINTLQVGIVVAKTLSLKLNKPLYDINHIEAHAYSPFINNHPNTIPQKAIVVIVSGGHTEILIKEGWKYIQLGSTRDDSIGESYDKVAKTLGYDYPGGKIIDEIASQTNALEIECPITNLPNYEFSYSGLKSHILNKSKVKNINKEGLIKGFQKSAITQIINKINKAIEEYNIKDVFIGGGVSANSLLRKKIMKIKDINVFLPKLKYTGDNAAMIGYLASIKIYLNLIEPSNLEMDADPRRKF
ncbi:MAG: tRNA N6-adenosine threonylcarbamoyltransferase [Candidatus Tyloplasma litorale]|nr:MAG: tRNA N6-adenosine threonylcarbamoyltransferase [Mycoplasmatales bacterium]